MLSSSYSTIRTCLVRMKKTIAMLEQRDDTRTSKQFAGYNVFKLTPSIMSILGKKYHWILLFVTWIFYIYQLETGGCRGRDRIVVGFTTISAHHH